MGTMFLTVLNMSITASYVILFVIVARLLLKKAPKIFSYALWSVVLFRLVSPLSFESIFSVIPISTQPVPTNIMYAQTPQIQSGIPVMDRVINSSLPAPVLGDSANPMQIWITLGEAIWIFGIFLLVIYSVYTAYKLHTKLKSARHLFDNVYESNGIDTPFVFGIIKPKIYLPVGLTDNEKAYILQHEQAHIRRFDHIVKPFAFLVVCVHWFNPLVWIAYFLMSEDMEMSCDESVIKQMGNGVKKDYSTSLLSLSTGRQIIGGSPLAFGESNTKGRIVNILHYKKPTFWVVIVAAIALVAISVALISNPMVSQLSVEDYAHKYIDQEIVAYNKNDLGYKIIESKITKLEKIGSFDNLLPNTIEIWSLEFRLRPDDISKVMLAGGMNEIDGWITEESSMGKPMLIFSTGSKLQYLGNTWSGESDYSTLAGQETALRVFLEQKDLLERETFKGNHIIVKFPLSNGETSQLLLSQPVVQGELGIWCVERWMDGTGNLYYETPTTELLLAEYYKELQKQSDDGLNTSLLDPIQVALDFINNDLGQPTSLAKLEIRYSATAKDFLETPESHYIGFISNFSTEQSSFHLDTVEWLTLEDVDRLKELNIDKNDLPNGYYIHNPTSYPLHFLMTEQTQYSIINWGGGTSPNDFYRTVNMKEFAEYLTTYLDDTTPPFRIVTKAGYVQSITEQYVP